MQYHKSPNKIGTKEIVENKGLKGILNKVRAKKVRLKGLLSGKNPANSQINTKK